VEAKSQVLSLNHLSTFKSAVNLMVVLQEQERWVEAEQTGQRALQSRVQAFGYEHLTMLNLKIAIAADLLEQKRWQEVNEMMEQVDEAKRRLRPDNPDTLDTMNSLAMSYYYNYRVYADIYPPTAGYHYNRGCVSLRPWKT
jgi:hypothetical protein